jgi:hypothetical protein
MKVAPLAMPPGNVVLLIMLVTLSLDVYRTFFAPDAPGQKAAKAPP